MRHRISLGEAASDHDTCVGSVFTFSFGCEEAVFGGVCQKAFCLFELMTILWVCYTRAKGSKYSNPVSQKVLSRSLCPVPALYEGREEPCQGITQPVRAAVRAPDSLEESSAFLVCEAPPAR